MQARIHRQTNGICCWCKAAYSEEVHHAAYATPLMGKVKDNELGHAGVALFPVCKRCHEQLHTRDLWHYGVDPVWDACNTKAVLQVLQRNFKELSSGR